MNRLPNIQDSLNTAITLHNASILGQWYPDHPDHVLMRRRVNNVTRTVHWAAKLATSKDQGHADYVARKLVTAAYKAMSYGASATDVRDAIRLGSSLTGFDASKIALSATHAAEIDAASKAIDS